MFCAAFVSVNHIALDVANQLSIYFSQDAVCLCEVVSHSRTPNQECGYSLRFVNGKLVKDDTDLLKEAGRSTISIRKARAFHGDRIRRHAFLPVRVGAVLDTAWPDRRLFIHAENRRVLPPSSNGGSSPAK
jgi:hypothetical protein